MDPGSPMMKQAAKVPGGRGRGLAKTQVVAATTLSATAQRQVIKKKAEQDVGPGAIPVDSEFEARVAFYEGVFNPWFQFIYMVSSVPKLSVAVVTAGNGAIAAGAAGESVMGEGEMTAAMFNAKCVGLTCTGIKTVAAIAAGDEIFNIPGIHDQAAAIAAGLAVVSANNPVWCLKYVKHAQGITGSPLILPDGRFVQAKTTQAQLQASLDRYKMLTRQFTVEGIARKMAEAKYWKKSEGESDRAISGTL
jgi:hypothetical protein